MAERQFRTALIVEPSLIVRRRLRQVALHAGIQRVLLADDGAQAAMLMGEELVDVVLTPWEAEGLAGMELLRALRKLARNRRVPIVLLDDGLHRQVIVTAVKAGVAGRLQLPAQPEQLREILSAIADTSGGKAPRTQTLHPE